jgi:hypothetical protein
MTKQIRPNAFDMNCVGSRAPWTLRRIIGQVGIVTPEGQEDFVVLVVPMPQERCVYKREYASGTLREKLFGHARLVGALHRRVPPVEQRTAAA